MPEPITRKKSTLVALTAMALTAAMFALGGAATQRGEATAAGAEKAGPLVYFAHGQAMDEAGAPIRLDPTRIQTEQARLAERAFAAMPTEARPGAGALQQALHEAAESEADRIISEAALIYWMLDRVKGAEANMLRRLNGGLLFSYPGSARGIGDDPDFWKNLGERPRGLLDKAGFNWPWIVSYTPPPPTQYMKDCLAAGVPVPPDWGAAEWLSHGQQETRFLTVETPDTEVFVYRSQQPEGLCMALPRSTGTTISTLQIICQGKRSSRACFWDNRINGVKQYIEKGQRRPIQDFTGGDNITFGGENCTDCHAGFNAFVVHPGTAVDLTQLGIDMQPTVWYQPIISPASPQNPGPETALANIPLGTASETLYDPLWGWFPWWRVYSVQERSCVGCHALPDVSKTPAYCGSVLGNAVERTMPPAPDTVHAGWELISSGTDLAFEKHINALRKACGRPPAQRQISTATWFQ